MTTITYNGQSLQATQVKMDINRHIEATTTLEAFGYLSPISIDATVKIDDANLDMLGQILNRRKIVFNCTEDMLDILRILPPKSAIVFQVGDQKIDCIITRRDYKRKKLYLLESIK